MARVGSQRHSKRKSILLVIFINIGKCCTHELSSDICTAALAVFIGMAFSDA